MSAIPGGITVPVTLDLTAAYAAYTQFLAYIAQNPPIIFPQVNYQYAGGGGGVTNVYNYNYTTNNYNTTRNITPNRGGGRGGGGGGRRRGSSFSRYLRGYFLARETERLVKDFADYNVKSGAADSDLARYKAEEGLQKSLFSIPLIGPLADVATLPSRAQTEQTVQQAEAQDRQTASMERAMEFAAGLNRQAAVDAAGPAGSDPAKLQEIDNRKAAEDERIRKQTKTDNEEIDKRVEGQKSEVTAAQQRYEVFKNLMNNVTGSIPSPLRDAILADPEGAAKGLGSFLPAGLADQIQRAAKGVRRVDVEGEDAQIDKDAEKLRGPAREREARERREAEEHARHEREELQYQTNRSLEQATQRTRVAEAQYNLQPDVARADQTYFSGIDAVEAARHRGRPQEALQDALATRFRLLGEQRELLNSGRAVEAENPFALAFSAADAAGHVSEETKRDDLTEALQELSGNLLPKIDQLIAELQGL